MNTQFGAYMGPLVHAQLMKLRNQQMSIMHAKLAVVAIDPVKSVPITTPSEVVSQFGESIYKFDLKMRNKFFLRVD
jgi:hypothetical protein